MCFVSRAVLFDPQLPVEEIHCSLGTDQAVNDESGQLAIR